MKSYKAMILLAVTGLGLAACKDESTGNGSVLVKVNHQGLKVGQAVVYMNRDSTYRPEETDDEFDKQAKADAAGEAQFDNLEPGKYYFYAEGREPGNKAAVWGLDSVVIKKRFRQNNYDVSIHTFLK